GHAVAWAYGGLVVGDICSGLLSQCLRSRKKVTGIFLILSFALTILYTQVSGISPTMYYLLCGVLGFSIGYWVIFVTVAAEQFGTNIRATVATTAPNFVRGALPLIILLYQFFRETLFAGNILYAALLVSTILTGVAFLALWGMRETFSEDLDYAEEI